MQIVVSSITMRKVSCISFRPSFALRLLAFCVSSPPIVIAIVIDKTLTTSPPYPFPRPRRCHLSTHPPPPSTPISHLILVVVVVVNVVNFDVFTRHWTVFDLTGSFSHNADLSTFSSNIYLCLSPYFHGTFRLFGFVPSCLAFLLGLLHRPTERIADLIGRRRLD